MQHQTVVIRTIPKTIENLIIGHRVVSRMKHISKSESDCPIRFQEGSEAVLEPSPEVLARRGLKTVIPGLPRETILTHSLDDGIH